MRSIILIIIWALCIGVGYFWGYRDGEAEEEKTSREVWKNKQEENALVLVDVFKEGMKAGGGNIIHIMKREKYITGEQRNEAQKILAEAVESVKYKSFN